MNNVPFLLGLAAAIFLVAGLWLLYRLYKRIARRCVRKGCGRLDVRRIHYIYLPPEENRFSVLGPEGKFRWWFRRVVKVTIAECPCKWSRVAKVDFDQISLWHIWLSSLFHKEIFQLPKTEHALVIHGMLRTLYLGRHPELHSDQTDTPDLLEGFLKMCEEQIPTKHLV